MNQVRPLLVGTSIEAQMDGDTKNTYKYEILDIIAQGGSGIIYRATPKNAPDEEPVILKEYYPYADSKDRGEYYRY